MLSFHSQVQKYQFQHFDSEHETSAITKLNTLLEPVIGISQIGCWGAADPQRATLFMTSANTLSNKTQHKPLILRCSLCLMHSCRQGVRLNTGQEKVMSVN